LSIAVGTLEPVVEQYVNRSIPLEAVIHDKESCKGLLIALSIITTWVISLMVLLLLDLSKINFLGIVCAVLFQTFLYAGLFITAHDAMHRSLFPRNYKINDFIGSLCVSLYAFFSYKQLLKNHWLHHRYPASDRDPDFHDGQFHHPVFWFFTFIKRYYGWVQFVAAAATYYIANGLLQISAANLLLFWVLPSLLSSMQLFYFGTFLPHRESHEGYANAHRARSNSFSTFWSFLACYHFGYHEEHHEYPSIPWWQLPIIRKLRIANSAARRELLAQ
jgi:beta-carotene/zeaxanthin 4-ketolase